MWAAGLLTSQLARRFFMLAAAVLVAAVIVAIVWARMAILEAQADAAMLRVEQSQKEAQSLRMELQMARQQVASMRAAEAARVDAQEYIERTTDARRKRNTATLVKPENAAVADIVLPSDMLDGLREQ